MKHLVLLAFLCLSTACSSDNGQVLRDPMFDEHAKVRSAALLELDKSSEVVDVAFLGDSHFEFMTTANFPFSAINLGIRGDTVFAIS